MTNFSNHFNCCGVRHIHSFDEDGDFDEASEVTDHLRDYPMARGLVGAGANAAVTPASRKLIEVILNREQVENNPVIIETLKQEGFRLVSEFNNSSGSDCFVFHRNNCGIRDRRPDNLDAHFPLGEQPPAPAPAAPEPPRPRVRTVFSSFHCVFADGRKGAGYDTVEEARENLGRRRRIDRRDIMSDGTTVWNEGVN